MTFSKILVIARHEYITNVRRLGFIFVTLLFPALGLLGLLVTVFFSGQASTFLQRQFTPEVVQIGLVDHSGLYTPVPSQFNNHYILYPDDAAAKQALLQDRIASYVVIPADYIASGKVLSYSKQGGFISTTTSTDLGALRAFLVDGLLAGKVDPALVRRAAQPANVTPVTLDDRGEPTTGGAFAFISGFVAPYVFSILLFVAVFAASGYLLRGVSEEKENRVIEIILSSVSATELLAGKVIGLGALGLTQIAVWLLSGVVLSGGLGAVVAGATLFLNPAPFLLAALYFMLGYLLYGTTMAAAGSLGTSLRESQQLAGIFSFMAAIPWFFAGFIFTNPNAPIVRILSFFPFTAPTMMMLRLPLAQVPTVDIIGSAAVLLISIPVVLWAGAKIFRMGLLMYGKRPALAEVIRALRAA